MKANNLIFLLIFYCFVCTIVLVQGVRTVSANEKTFSVASSNLPANPSSFSLSAPANGIWVSATPLFMWTVSAGTQNYNLYIDGILKKGNISGASYQLLLSEAITSGLHTWYIIADNGTSTQSSETWSFRVDATPPAPFDLTDPHDNSWSRNLQPTLTWSASSDALSGLSKYQLWIDDTLNRDNITSSSTSTTPSIDLSNGTHIWKIEAIDNAGNIQNSSKTSKLSIDNIPPNADKYKDMAYQISKNNMIAKTNSTNILNINSNKTFTIEAWINQSSSFIWNIWGNYGTIIEKIVNYSFVVLKKTSSTYSICCKIGNSSIESTVLDINRWYHFSATFDGSSIRLYINGNLDAISTGVVSYSPNTDTRPLYIGGYANTNGIKSFLGMLDELRIWSSIRTQSEIFENMNHVIEPADHSDLVGYWRFNNYDGATVFDETINKLNLTKYNDYPLDNTSIIEVNRGLINLNSLKSPNFAQYLATSTPNFVWGKATDSGIGFRNFQLFIDNSLAKDNLLDSTTTLTNPLSYGKHTWYVKAFDSLDNNQSSYIRIFYIDNIKPKAFNLLTPKNYQIVDLPTPNLSWEEALDSAGGSGLHNYQLWLNNAINRDSIPITQTTVAPKNALAQGVYTWYIRAYDNVGNYRQSTQTNTFYVDWESPTNFTLVTPINNQTVTINRPTFVWHPSFDIGSGLTKYELNISGFPPIEILPTDTTYTISYDLPNGSYSWFVKAFDLAGGTTSSNTLVLKVDMPLPGQSASPTGSTILCKNSSNTTYVTTGANFATSYIWAISPTNAGIISGSGTTASVDWDNTFTGTAQIWVKGHNNQGDGVLSNPTIVYINPLPDAASTPMGAIAICIDGANTDYTTDTITNATSYIWSISPIEAGTISGTSTKATVNWNNTYSGTANIAVKGNNDCGDGAISQNLKVDIYTLPGQAVIPTGEISLFQNKANTEYVTTGATNSTNYIWDLQPTNAGVIVLDVTQKKATVDWSDSFQGNATISVKGHNDCGVGQESSLTVTVNAYKRQNISISAGWNIISANVTPSNLDLKAIFQPLIVSNQIKKIMDESGKAIEDFGAFGGWKNNIGNLSATEGYKVNAISASTLTLEGIPLPLPMEIPLTTGWNIISYPDVAPRDALPLFQPLIDAGKLKKVMDESGKAIEDFGAFGGWKNNIGNLLPGKGYKVNTTSNITLNIPTAPSPSAPSVTTQEVTDILATTATGNGILTGLGNPNATAYGVCWNTSTNPTTENSHIEKGVALASGSFFVSITGLKANTTYYLRAYAVNSVGTVYGNNVSFKTLNSTNEIIFNPNLAYGSLTDIDGNTYKTIVIGTQTWMAENLKTTKYNDGTAIPNVMDGATWQAFSTEAYCWYNNDSTKYKATYGALYNWLTVSSVKLCPTGWHVPKKTEWTILSDYLGGQTVAGAKMKETGILHWQSLNEATTNEAGFTALPAGNRWGEANGAYAFAGSAGYWWSSTERNFFNDAYCATLPANGSTFTQSEYVKKYGLSVRCLKGEALTIKQPVIGAVTVTNISNHIATFFGNITSDGGATIINRGFLWSTSPEPNAICFQGSDGKTDLGSFSFNVTQLEPNTTYYVRAFATNSEGFASSQVVSFKTQVTANEIIFNPELTYGFLTDIDGNTYKTIVIGTQTWMAENLKTTKYNDGSVIPNVTDNAAWKNLTTSAYCWNNNNEATNEALYNWYSVNTGKLCPTGWHVPSDAEWTALTTFLGGESVAGGKMKEAGTSHWSSPNTDATNASGFSGLPVNYRDDNGSFYPFDGYVGIWWSTTQLNTTIAWGRSLVHFVGVAGRDFTPKVGGYSVRCLGD